MLGQFGGAQAEDLPLPMKRRSRRGMLDLGQLAEDDDDGAEDDFGEGDEDDWQPQRRAPRGREPEGRKGQQMPPDHPFAGLHPSLLPRTRRNPLADFTGHEPVAQRDMAALIQL